MSSLWLRHDAVLAHEIPGHPERPERIRALEAAMAARDWFGWRVADAPPAEREQLLAVHPAAHVDALAALCARGGGQIDADTACVPATWEAALRAAGGAVALVDALLGGEADSGFAGLRPPGHHAEPERAMGFCYLANVAIAARQATRVHGVERVLIVDWDVHHGNGTEAIFRTADDVLFVSLHEWPLYPGTGPARERGAGPGLGYTVNLPVPAGSGDAEFTSLVEHVVVPLARCWQPQLVLVSAGFDAHALDPLASCRVTETGYATMTASLRRVADGLGAPLGVVLEGGYSTVALARSVSELMPILGGDVVPDPGPVPEHPLASRARAALAPHWPGL